jgi:D-amino peptidase
MGHGMGPRVLLIFDMEGVSGISSGRTVSYQDPGYDEARRHLTADVNATIRGLRAGGAGEIVIQDGHGSGNQEQPDILESQLDLCAKIDYREHPYSPYTSGLDQSVDCLVLVGMHCGPTLAGFVPHIFNPEVLHYRVNGVELSEPHVYALSAARWGIPIIMASGDDQLRDQLCPDLAFLDYVCVKKAVNFVTAECLPARECRQALMTTARNALDRFRRQGSPLIHLPSPYTFQIEWRNREQARGARRHPGVQAYGNTGVTFVRDDPAEGFELSMKLFELAWDGHAVLERLLMSTPQGREILQQLSEALILRITAPEHAPSYVNPAVRSPLAHTKRRYFGIC